MKLEGLSAELEAKYGDILGLLSLSESVHIPDIVHSTVMRHASEPSDASALARGLADLSDRWEPARVRVDKVFLVHEVHPYMHLSRTEGEVTRFLLE